jgi:hypothetical protein
MDPYQETTDVVYVAVRRRDRRFGYFATESEIPSEGWERCSSRSITGIMESMRCSKEQALELMNEGLGL